MSQEKNTDSPKNFGHRLRWFRNARGLSQADLGKSVNRTGTSISEWEKGVTEPSIDQIEKLAATLGVSPAKLAFGVAEDQQAPYGEPKKYRDSGSLPAVVASPPAARSATMLDPRFQPRAEPTPEMCAQYFAEFLERAKQEPGGIGFTWRLLQKHFPLDEFEPKPK